MTLAVLQNTLLEKLQDIFPAPGYRVEDFPDDPVNYQFAHSNAAILLVFNDRKFDAPRATDGTIQPNQPVFQVAFLSRQLRTRNENDGAYELLDTTRAKLQGFMIDHEPIWIQREYFQRLKPGGVWIFGQDWTFDHETE
jgi:hypothetical protein